jgi:hypothetical protein
VSAKERVVFLDRAAFSADELPIPHGSTPPLARCAGSPRSD